MVSIDVIDYFNLLINHTSASANSSCPDLHLNTTAFLNIFLRGSIVSLYKLLNCDCVV